MPLWLQGVLEFVQAALITAVAILVPIVAVWVSGGFADKTVDAILRLGGQAWLWIHGVPLTVQLAQGLNSSQLQSGLMTLTPLGLTLIPFFLCWRAGRRLARASYTDQLWQAMAGGLVAYAAMAIGTAFVTATEGVGTAGVPASLVALIPAALGLVIGARREAGSWGRLIGVDAAAWSAKTGQHSRWAGSYAWAGLKAGFVAAVAAAGLAALMLAVTLVVHWPAVISVYEQLDPGITGAAALTVLQLGYLPNLAIWSLSWVSGAGFSLGIGSSVGPLATSVGPLPAVPVLGALPPGQLQYGFVALIIPVAAGVLAGWWFLRAGENHFDEWLAIRVRVRWFSATVSTLTLAAIIGAVAGVLAGAAGWLARGSLGIGRLTEMGPNPLTMAAWVAAEVAVGAVIGYVLGPWLEHESYGSADHKPRAVDHRHVD